MEKSYAYDWTWRSGSGPMTFRLLFHEAVEICSPELYTRRAVAKTLAIKMYTRGLLPEVLASGRRDNLTRWLRLIDQAFVRAYLKERRAGLAPRRPGPPTETWALVAEASASVSAEAERVTQRRQTLARQTDTVSSKRTSINRITVEVRQAVEAVLFGGMMPEKLSSNDVAWLQKLAHRVCVEAEEKE